MTEELTNDDVSLLKELADHSKRYQANKQYWHLQDKGLVVTGPDHWVWKITDKGKEVVNDWTDTQVNRENVVFEVHYDAKQIQRILKAVPHHFRTLYEILDWHEESIQLHSAGRPVNMSTFPLGSIETLVETYEEGGSK